MKRSEPQSTQYTIRNVPRAVDAALRRRARAQGRSLNHVALDALTQAVGLTEDRPKRRDLSDLAGTWERDRKFDQAIAEMDRVDPDMWS